MAAARVEVSFEQGNRGAVPAGDRKIFVRTNGRELWGYETELAELLTLWAENEDRIFPPSQGYQGRKYLAWYVRLVIMEGKEAANRKNEARKRSGQQRRLFDLMEEEGLEE